MPLPQKEQGSHKCVSDGCIDWLVNMSQCICILDIRLYTLNIHNFDKKTSVKLGKPSRHSQCRVRTRAGWGWAEGVGPQVPVHPWPPSSRCCAVLVGSTPHPLHPHPPLWAPCCTSRPPGALSRLGRASSMPGAPPFGRPPTWAEVPHHPRAAPHYTGRACGAGGCCAVAGLVSCQ